MNRLRLDASLKVRQAELESLQRLDAFMENLSSLRSTMAQRIERKLEFGGETEPGPLKAEISGGKLVVHE